MAFEYKKIDMTKIDRKKVKETNGIDTFTKIKVYDENKHIKDLLASPINVTNIRCFWDHHLFDGEGVFCPISYKPRQVAKVTDDHIIKENIYKTKKIKCSNTIIELNDAYYEVDGVFCSPECCLAFINDKKLQPGGSKYFESERLLYNMLGITSGKLRPANSIYGVLAAYGGELSIEDFRKCKSIRYEYHGTTVLISHLFEKKINLATL